MKRFFNSATLCTAIFFSLAQAKAIKTSKGFHPKSQDSIATLIPQKKQGKYGFITRHKQLAIPHIYSNVGFFTEDCQLLNSPNPEIRKFGSKAYASVRFQGNDYRIDKQGNRVYQFKNIDKGKCLLEEYKPQKFFAYVQNGLYGVVSRSSSTGKREYIIYPEYEYLHIMEGNDLNQPMIIAVRNGKFGVINIKNEIVIPFIYQDIKRNFSWKLARLFEVTKDNKNYYYVDVSNVAY